MWLAAVSALGRTATVSEGPTRVIIVLPSMQEEDEMDTTVTVLRRGQWNKRKLKSDPARARECSAMGASRSAADGQCVVRFKRGRCAGPGARGVCGHACLAAGAIPIQADCALNEAGSRSFGEYGSLESGGEPS